MAFISEYFSQRMEEKRKEKCKYCLEQEFLSIRTLGKKALSTTTSLHDLLAPKLASVSVNACGTRKLFRVIHFCCLFKICLKCCRHSLQKHSLGGFPLKPLVSYSTQRCPYLEKAYSSPVSSSAICCTTRGKFCNFTIVSFLMLSTIDCTTPIGSPGKGSNPIKSLSCTSWP